MTEQVIKWSYSRLKTFKTCGRKYQNQYITREFEEPFNQQASDGTLLHEVLEHAGKSGTPLPSEWSHLQPTFDILQSVEGDKFYEHVLAYDINLNPTSPSSSERWWKGVIDWLCIRGANAFLVDYKKSTKPEWIPWDELEIFAIAVFVNFPHVNHIRGAMWGIDHKYFITREYERSGLNELMLKHYGEVYRLQESHRQDKWSATPSGLCKKHCPVKTCEHYGRGTRRF